MEKIIDNMRNLLYFSVKLLCIRWWLRYIGQNGRQLSHDSDDNS